MREDAKNQLEKEREISLKNAHKEAENEIVKIQNKIDGQKKTLREKVKKNEEKAIDFLFEKVVKI